MKTVREKRGEVEGSKDLAQSPTKKMVLGVWPPINRERGHREALQKLRHQEREKAT